MTLTFKQQDKLRSPMHLNREKRQNVIKWQKSYWEIANGYNIYVYENIFASFVVCDLKIGRYR